MAYNHKNGRPQVGAIIVSATVPPRTAIVALHSLLHIGP